VEAAGIRGGDAFNVIQMSLSSLMYC
jgi:hypothetical protein